MGPRGRDTQKDDCQNRKDTITVHYKTRTDHRLLPHTQYEPKTHPKN